MGYWNNAVKRHFPHSQAFSEDWDAGTVSFEMIDYEGSLTISLDNKTRDQLMNTFGSASLSITARPHKRENSPTGGVILKITIMGANFPTRP